MRAAEEEEILEDGAEEIGGESEQAEGGSGAEGAETDAAASEKKPAVAIDYAAEYKRSQKELKAERASRKESDETARYWAEQARSKPAKAAEAEKEDDLSDVDLVNELTSNGIKGLDGLLGRMGYAKRKDVDATIAATRSEITSQADLMRVYPDLGDKHSEFFKLTASIYNSLTGDDPQMHKGKAIGVAARMAKAELAANGGRRSTRRDPDPDVEDGEFEEDGTDPRDARIARQSGDRGRREARRAAPTISAAERAMVENFRRAGADIDEKRYLETALKGVAIGGIPANHRGQR